MAQARPTSVTVMAILNIIFGSLFTLMCMCEGASLVMNAAGMNPGQGGNDPNVRMMEQLMSELPGYMVVRVATFLLNFSLSVLLLVSGIGLLNMKSWARVASIIYGVVNIL